MTDFSQNSPEIVDYWPPTIWHSPHARELPDWRERTLLMAIVNVTPDSFSDGGKFSVPEAAAAHAAELVEQGADVIDLGAESTRPGAPAVPARSQLARLLPALEKIREILPNVPVSIDTSLPEVARATIAAGADILNDVRAISSVAAMQKNRYELGEIAAELGAPIIATHNRRGEKMSDVPAEFVRELREDLLAGTRNLQNSGVPAEQIWLDPGFGFGKTHAQNLAILANLRELDFGWPLLIGTSRKSTLGFVLGDAPVDARGNADFACAAISIFNGASMLRVHDVRHFAEIAKTAQAISRERAGTRI